MNLKISGQLFIVGGATSGFGRAVTACLAGEGAIIITIARGSEALQELQKKYPDNIEILCADIMHPDTKEHLLTIINGRQVHGVLINAGGPPAKTASEATLEDWDTAYKTVLRWKIDMMQTLVPGMINDNYGRIVFVESASVKQPMENLVLSNSIRLAVVGYVKTLSQEISKYGITINVLAPGYHVTAAMDRLLKKKTEQTGLTEENVVSQYINQTSVGFLGAPEDFASLATWLLSPHSRYITGQTISVDGGVVKGTMG